MSSTRANPPPASPKPSAAPGDDWPSPARAANYAATASATPGFGSPEGLNRLLEQRWPLANIRAFCIPARRANPMYQNLVADTPEVWKGRLYANTDTGFDRIFWYATVEKGRVLEYSLNVERGDDYWLLEIGSPETIHHPPQVTPDPSQPRFVNGREPSQIKGLDIRPQ